MKKIHALGLALALGLVGLTYSYAQTEKPKDEKACCADCCCCKKSGEKAGEMCCAKHGKH